MSVIAKKTSFKHYGLIAPIQSRWLPWFSWVWTIGTNAYTVKGKQVWYTRSPVAREVRPIARGVQRFLLARLLNLSSQVSKSWVELPHSSVRAPARESNNWDFKVECPVMESHLGLFQFESWLSDHCSIKLQVPRPQSQQNICRSEFETVHCDSVFLDEFPIIGNAEPRTNWNG